MVAWVCECGCVCAGARSRHGGFRNTHAKRHQDHSSGLGGVFGQTDKQLQIIIWMHIKKFKSKVSCHIFKASS